VSIEAVKDRFGNNLDPYLVNPHTLCRPAPLSDIDNAIAAGLEYWSQYHRNPELKKRDFTDITEFAEDVIAFHLQDGYGQSDVPRLISVCTNFLTIGTQSRKAFNRLLYEISESPDESIDRRAPHVRQLDGQQDNLIRLAYLIILNEKVY
jgi:hypothetical protein